MNTLIRLILFFWNILWPGYLVVLEVPSGKKGTEKKVLKNVTALLPTIKQAVSSIQNSNPYMRNSKVPLAAQSEA